jgi:hypothetical protein
MNTINILRIMILLIIKQLIKSNSVCNPLTSINTCQANRLCRWQNYGRFNCIDYPCSGRKYCFCTSPCVLNSDGSCS